VPTEKLPLTTADIRQDVPTICAIPPKTTYETNCSETPEKLSTENKQIKRAKGIANKNLTKLAPLILKLSVIFRCRSDLRFWRKAPHKVRRNQVSIDLL
jgi:hypothetical protein